jgi:hypothetical protein
MMERLRGWGFWAGIALIVTANAFVLGGVAYNRNSAPDSTVRLSQRELAPPYDWGMAKENSGLSLRILNRVASGRSSSLTLSADNVDARYFYLGRGEPDWLDDARLATLGIDAKQLRAHPDEPRGGAPIAREVLFVLEQDGPAYAAALARARQIADSEAAMAAADPGKEEFTRRAKNAADAARYEEREGSRLFVIDAGLDRDALRAKYPNRQRYAIVRGILRPMVAPVGKPVVSIDRLSVGDVNVPHSFRQLLAPLVAADQTRPRNQPRARFEATVAWGNRLEPWMLDATAH